MIDSFIIQGHIKTIILSTMKLLILFDVPLKIYEIKSVISPTGAEWMSGSINQWLSVGQY